MELQIKEFGQTPRQLFDDPHPKKLVTLPESQIQSVSLIIMPASTTISHDAVFLSARQGQ